MNDLVVLDGAMGTELTRRGADTTLPLWSARALIESPDLVARIHRDYADAGAHVLTADTFRTNVRTFARAGMAQPADVARALTETAVALARGAAGHGVRVAGSLAPVEDCYSPWLVPTDDELQAEHGALAHDLAGAGCDLLLVETMNTIREAVAAVRAAAATGLPRWVSFTLDGRGNVLSGEALRDAVAAVLPFGPQAVLVNCIPVAEVEAALARLRAAVPETIAIGAYANVGHVDEVVGWTLTDAVSPAAYADAARRWRARGAGIIGGCCGTSPDHTRALRALPGGE